jgi:hypothetical protein
MGMGHARRPVMDKAFKMKGKGMKAKKGLKMVKGKKGM